MNVLFCDLLTAFTSALSDSVSDGQSVNLAFESFWYFCDELGTLYFQSKAVRYDSQVLHILTGTEDMTHSY